MISNICAGNENYKLISSNIYAGIENHKLISICVKDYCHFDAYRFYTISETAEHGCGRVVTIRDHKVIALFKK